MKILNQQESSYYNQSQRTGVLLKTPETAYSEISSLLKKKKRIGKFLIFHEEESKYLTINQETSIVNIGKSSHNEIFIDDHKIARIQVTILLFGKFAFFINSCPQNKVTFNGLKSNQVVCDIHTRMIIKINKSLIIYCPENKDSESIEKGITELSLKINKKKHISNKRPILIGCHPACDLVLKNLKHYEPFHSIIYFSMDGLFIEGMSSSSLNIDINGIKSIGSRPITENSELEIQDQTVFISVDRKLYWHCKNLFKDYKKSPQIVLTNLCSNLSPFILPNKSKRLALGRSTSCDVVLQDASVSRIHAYIKVDKKNIYLYDNDSLNKVYVNRKIVNRAIIKPGDIIELGDTPLLVNYEYYFF